MNQSLAALTALTLLLGIGCGWFQYWMALHLDRKRWLLVLQPGMFTVVFLCFLAWTMSIKKLAGSPARLACLPFGVLLLCTITGWIMAERKKRKKE